ncbi:MAG: cytochrome c biogenesis protein CcdA [Deltaproteobacteria bacterium]|nr:cytochrome c biogenesis protein CcdA [Deltaproteobacteria bacterium]
METEISIIVAFSAGLLSFLSPCVLPLVPGYIAFVSGIQIDQMTKNKLASKEMKTAMINSIMFVIGFSVVFVAMGASATLLGKFLTQSMPLLINIAGIIIIIFGLQQIGIFRLGLMMTTKQIELPADRLGIFKAPLLGAAFAFGWTPCIGPILAAILTYAATMDTVGKGVILLMVYSAGLGIPFLLTTVAMNAFFKLFSKIRKHMNIIGKISGVILVILGILMISGKLTLITAKLGFLNWLSL